MYTYLCLSFRHCRHTHIYVYQPCLTIAIQQAYVVVLVNNRSYLACTLQSLIYATIGCSVLTAPSWINVTDVEDHDGVIHTTISWDAPCGEVDFYTFYYDDGTGICDNVILASTTTSHTVEDGQEMQIVTHRNDMKECSPGIYICTPATPKHY